MKEVDNVVIAIENNEKYLILKRSKKETKPGIWEFPAGKMERNEKPMEAAIRELKEETNISANKKNLKFVGLTYRPRKNDIVKSHLFLSEIDGATLKKIKLSGEHDNYKIASKMTIREHKDIGFETIRCLNKIEGNETINLFIDKLKKKFSEHYDKDEVGVMLVGSGARNDFLNDWSDFDVVVYFKKTDIELQDLYNLRKINQFLNSLGHQTWFKVHTPKDFPKLYETSMAYNYYNDGIQLFGIDIKRVLKRNFNDIKDEIIKCESKKCKNFHWSPRFFFRYFTVAINDENKTFGSVHIDKINDNIDPGKLRVAKFIDNVLDNAYQLLFRKNFIPSCDKFKNASLFVFHYNSLIPFKLLEKRERLWYRKKIPEDEVKEIEKICFEFYENIYPKIVGDCK